MVDLRVVMATFPSGVGVVTAFGHGAQPAGMTCTSITGVALEPPCLLVSLRTASPTLEAVRTLGGFALNLLQAEARPVAELFASGRPDRFDQVRWETGPGARGPHLSEAAHTTADCRVLQQTSVGDHTVVFGEVTRIVRHTEARPLLFGLRGYAQWPDPARLSHGV